MANLKLQKPQWFSWFDNTYLDSITHWVEYYYINPDSQHWISNNQIDLEDVAEDTINGITISVINNKVSVGGTATSATFINIPLKSKIPIGTYSYNQFSKETGHNVYLTDEINTGRDLILTNSTTRSYGTLTTTAVDSFLYLYVGAGNTIQPYSFTPILIKGTTIPSVYNPHLIKIEDILETVDMGSINWSYNSEFKVFYGYIPTKKVGRTNVYSDMYTTVDKHYRDLNNMEIAGTTTDNGINVKNLNYNDPQAFKTAMTNVYLIVMKDTSPYGTQTATTLTNSMLTMATMGSLNTDSDEEQEINIQPAETTE